MYRLNHYILNLLIASSLLAACTDPEAPGDDGETTATGDEGPGDGDPGDGDPGDGDPGDGDPGDGDPGDGDPGDGDGDPGGDHLTSAHCPSTPAHAPGTGVFAGGGGVEGRVASSLDGADWIDETTVSNGPQYEGHSRNLIRGFGYGGGVFVAVGGLDNAYVARSCDGATWEHDLLGTNIEGEIEASYANFLSDVAYADAVFVAAGGAGMLLRSGDHSLTWERVGPQWYDGHLRGIAAGGGRFVAVGHAWDGDVGATIVSSDGGLSWSAIAESPGGLWQVVHAHGRFVAIGPGRCASSDDGEQWMDCGVDAGPGLNGLHFVAGELLLQRGDGTYLGSADAIAWQPAVPGWLPDTMAFDGARVVMTRWQQRGYADAPTGEWTTVDLPGLAELAWGPVVWAG